MSLEISNEKTDSVENRPIGTLEEVSDSDLGLNNPTDDRDDEDDDEQDDLEEEGAEMDADEDDDEQDKEDDIIEEDPDMEEDTEDEDIEEEEEEGANKQSTSTTMKKNGQLSNINSMLGLNFAMTEQDKGTVGSYTDTETDTDDEVDEESYLQKLKTQVREDYILDSHPELRTHNFDEVLKMSKITRDKYGNITDPFHKTTTTMTKYEKAKVLGQRAKQIDQGAKVFVKVPATTVDGYLIALEELKQKKLPFIIRRPLPNGGVEYWPVKELEVIH